MFWVCVVLLVEPVVAALVAHHLLHVGCRGRAERVDVDDERGAGGVHLGLAQRVHGGQAGDEPPPPRARPTCGARTRARSASRSMASSPALAGSFTGPSTWLSWTLPRAAAGPLGTSAPTCTHSVRPSVPRPRAEGQSSRPCCGPPGSSPGEPRNAGRAQGPGRVLVTPAVSPPLSVVIPYSPPRPPPRRASPRRSPGEAQVVLAGEGSVDVPSGTGVQVLSGMSGKGAAIRAALAQVTGAVTVLQDPDAAYSPESTRRCAAPSTRTRPTRSSAAARARARAEAGGPRAGRLHPLRHGRAAGGSALRPARLPHRGAALADAHQRGRRGRRGAAGEARRAALPADGGAAGAASGSAARRWPRSWRGCAR